MQNSEWVTLLRRIPLDQQNSMALMTTVGIELNIQDIMRIEEDHVVIRGRQAGTITTGRIFFIPYQQIGYLCLQKEMKEAQIRVFYDQPSGAASVEAAPASSSPKPAATEAPAAEKKPEPPPPPPEIKPPLEPPKAGQLKIPRKSGLLERLRARTQGGTHSRPPSTP